MELGFDWEVIAAPIKKEEAVKGTKDLRIHPTYQGLYTKCSAVEGEFKQTECKYYEKVRRGHRCSYQAWKDFDMCRKCTLTDGSEIN